MSKNSRLVYSTESGRVSPQQRSAEPPQGDGIVRIRRETSGRKGKGVTTVSGTGLDVKALGKLARELKQHCGSGGSVKDFIIEIQGDHREKVRELLEKKGFTVKLAGG